MSTDQESINQSKVEKDLKKVIDDCKNIVNDSNVLSKSNSLVGQLTVKQNEITLEKVVRDMTYVLYDLKNGLKLIKSTSKIPSSFNIERELENVYKKQEEIKKKRQHEEEKKKKAGAKSNEKTANVNEKGTVGGTKQEQKKDINNRPILKRGSTQSAQNKQNVINTKTNSAEDPSRRRPTSPNSAGNNKNQTKIIVTTVKFPPENVKIIPNAITGSTNRNRDSGSSSGRPKSPEQTLRKPSPSVPRRRVVSVPPPREVYNPLGVLQDEVDKAVKEGKTFTIKGHFPVIRKSLLKRGWVEKYPANYREKINDEIRKYCQMNLVELVDLLRNKELAPTIKRLIKSKLLKDHQVDLYWDHTFDAFKECPDTKKLTMINRFKRGPFSYTSKQGLCQAARENHWLQIPGVAKINHPRCYVLAKGGDTKSFLKDFGLTAATCLLKWVVRNNITGESKIVSETGKIPIKNFDFAITECYKFIKKEKHQDIDEEIEDALEKEWNDFLDQYYKAVHIGNHFKLPNKTVHPSLVAKDMVRKANYLLNELREYMPCLDMDGYMNIWILKPINSCRGQGIHICRTLQYILDIVKKNPNRRYVIQKYIERPLLIHDTKFDIRQWFLVSSGYPLTIWIYKLCYLRFSCQTYNLRKLHESIHLTNNSVQVKYMKNVSRDPLLPPFGMWDSQQFKGYLSNIGYPTIFEDTIYPGMKQCITGAMIAHRDKIDRRKNCFEMYGADFMLSENFEPWLLEINSNPALHASTPVTAKMCPEVLEDVIKVVVDYARSDKANTGNFELIYKEKLENHTANTKANFQVTGTAVSEDYFCDIAAEEPKTTRIVSKRFETPDPGRFLLQTGETMKNALKNLLEIVKREKMKRRSRKEKAIEAKLLADVCSAPRNREIISIYQNNLSRRSSGFSVKLSNLNLNSQEQISEDESKKITEVLSEIASLQSKKQVLSSLFRVVDTLASKSKSAKL